MSGLPTRQVGRGGNQQLEPGNHGREGRSPARAATTLGRVPPPSGLRTPMRQATGIPSRSGIPVTSTPGPQRQATQVIRSRLQPPTAGLAVGVAGSRTRIPAASSGIPAASRLQRPQYTSGAIPKVLQPPRSGYPSGSRSRTGEVTTGAIPKSSSKGISVQRQTKSGPQMVTKTSSRKIIQGDPEEEKSSKPRKLPKPSKLREPTLGKKGPDRDAEDEIDEVDNPEEWDQARARTSVLEQELESTLLEAAARRPKTPMVGTTSRKSAVSPPLMMTEYGPIPVQTQVITTKSVTKQPGYPDVIGHDVTTIEATSPCTAERTEVVMSRVSPYRPGVHSPKTKEAVIVQNKVGIAPGYKQTVKTVTYEGDPDDIRQASVIPSPKSVAKMVREETALINETLAIHMPDVKRMSPSTYPIRKKALGYSFDKDTVEPLETHELCATCTTTPAEMEEPTPEMIADMMNTEERGLTMGDAPTNVYNYLFSGSGEEPKIEVSSAAPYPLQDVVVPNKVPNMAMAIQNVEDVLNVSMRAAASATANNNDKDDNTYCAVVGDEPLQSKNAARKGNKTKRKRVTLLASEPPPWGAIDEVEPVIDLVGASLAQNRTVRVEAEGEPDPLVEGIEFLLQMEAPQHFSKIQMRGTQKPDWFPGYMMALPNVPNLITLAKSPSEVFAAAWRATQPDIFNDDSLFII